MSVVKLYQDRNETEIEDAHIVSTVTETPFAYVVTTISSSKISEEGLAKATQWINQFGTTPDDGRPRVSIIVTHNGILIYRPGKQPIFLADIYK